MFISLISLITSLLIVLVHTFTFFAIIAIVLPAFENNFYYEKFNHQKIKKRQKNIFTI